MEEVECNYCGKTFEAETKIQAETQEGIHRTNEHIDSDGDIAGHSKDTNENIVDSWKDDKKEA